jgi:hypothetical protein
LEERVARLEADLTQKTRQESKFINLCLQNRNPRLAGCVLARAIDDTKRSRRTRRLARLQKSWPASALIRTGTDASDSAAVISELR